MKHDMIDPADDDSYVYQTPPDPYDLPTLISNGSQAWRDTAACRGMSVDIFFPERGQNGKVADAKKICERCPVAPECLAEALVDPMNSGIWGATSHMQRRATRSANNPVESARHRKDIMHGTNRGYQAHNRRHETPCDDCRKAHTADRQKRKKAREKAATK